MSDNGSMPAMPNSEARNDGFGDYTATYSGLTKREMFAMAAMQGLLAGCKEKDLYEDKFIPQWATIHADALLAQLSKESKP